MTSFRSAGGISEGEIYKERISYASSEKERFFHFDSQSRGTAGISSGIKSPPSDARPFSTTSSNESYDLLADILLPLFQWVVVLRRILLLLKGTFGTACELCLCALQ